MILQGSFLLAAVIAYEVVQRWATAPRRSEPPPVEPRLASDGGVGMTDARRSRHRRAASPASTPARGAGRDLRRCLLTRRRHRRRLGRAR